MQLEINTQETLYLLLFKAYEKEINNNTKDSHKVITTELGFYSWLLQNSVISKEHYNNLVKDKSNQKVGVVDTDSQYQPLFDHMSKEHNVLLTQSEMDEIINIVKKIEL